MHTTTPFSYAYKNVQKWGEPKKNPQGLQPNCRLLDNDFIVVPINHYHLHWSCVVIDLKQKEIVSYDSVQVSAACTHTRAHPRRIPPTLLPPSSLTPTPQHNEDTTQRVMDDLEHYMRDKAKEYRLEYLNTWTKRHCRTTPQQTNAVDCGVFTIMWVTLTPATYNHAFNTTHLLPTRPRRCAHHLALGLPLNYTQDDMHAHRRTILHRLLNGRL